MMLLLLTACTGDEPQPSTDTQQTAAPQDTQALPDETAPADSGTPAPMRTDGTIDHLAALAAIAAENSGTRHAGSPGYDASADYIEARLTAAGYAVIRDTFTFETFVENRPPTLQVEETTYTPHEDFTTLTYSGAGDVTATVQAVDVQIPPAEAENTSTSGCQAEDFADFVAGNIALIQRGSCTFADKAAGAEAAGAVGVILFNEGQPGRRDAFGGTLSAAEPASIPVVSATYALGETLAAGSIQAHLIVDVTTQTTETVNLLAETTGRDDRVLVVGAHLDSVSAGAGINDNGSGSAGVLELAEELARVGHAPVNRIRFAFWGAEELGLVGSTSYVSRLEQGERDRILANLNFDMIASPNFARFVYDGDGSDTSTAGPEGSAEIEALFIEHFTSEGLTASPTAFSGRSDYGPFIAVGIPAGGLFTGAEGSKSTDEVATYGGEAEVAYDVCYHQGCDGLENINTEALSQMTGALFAVTMALADDEAPLGASKAREAVDLTAAMLEPEWRGKKYQR